MTPQEQDDQRRVLAVLAKARWPMRRRAIEDQAFGRTSYMAFRTIAAIRSLCEQGFVESAYEPRTGSFDRTYRATPDGVRHSEGVAVFHPSSGGRTS